MIGRVEVVLTSRLGRVLRRVRQFNLRTNGGAMWWENQVFGLVPLVTPALWVGISTDATAPQATDSALPNELLTLGLARSQGIVTYTPPGNTLVLSVVFTYQGSAPVTVQKAGLFTAAAGGTLVNETLLAAPITVLNPGDQITLNWSVTF